MAATAQSQAIFTFPIDNSVARLRYFLGQVLTQRDLQLEQTYHLLLQRLTQREAFGTGTVAGLAVGAQSSAGATVSQSVFVAPGFALDPDGRELILERESAIQVADPLVSAVSNPFTSTIDNKADLAAAIASRFGAAFASADLDRLVDALFASAILTQAQHDTYAAGDTAANIADIRALVEKLPTPAQTPVVAPPETLGEWLFDQFVGVTYVGVQYRESGTDPAPALLDAVCCGDTVCFPSRTQEGVALVASRSPFAPVRDPFAELKVAIDTQFFGQIQASGTAPTQLDCRAALAGALLGAWRGSPPVAFSCADVAFAVVPLAKVEWRRIAAGASDPQILGVDNVTFRPLAPGTPAVRALLESLTSCATPANLAPTIVAIAPADRAEVTAQATTDTTNPFTLIARADASLHVASGSSLASSWQITFYPVDASAVQTFPDSGGKGPGGSTVAVSFAGPGSTATNGTEIHVTFTGGTAFPPGTYVWSLPNGSGSTFVADTSNVQLDGEPNPPAAVPSGDGKPGGAFSARFFVRA